MPQQQLQPPRGLPNLQHRGQLRQPGTVLTCQSQESSSTTCSQASRCPARHGQRSQPRRGRE
eukprot:3186183-Lingulodinium_polyedra.AAC.1